MLKSAVSGRLFSAKLLSMPDARLPRGELGTIDDVASAVHYLASDHANMASGSILVIDGGWTTV